MDLDRNKPLIGSIDTIKTIADTALRMKRIMNVSHEWVTDKLHDIPSISCPEIWIYGKTESMIKELPEPMKEYFYAIFDALEKDLYRREVNYMIQGDKKTLKWIKSGSLQY